MPQELGEIDYGESPEARTTEKPRVTRPTIPAMPSKERGGQHDSVRGPEPAVVPPSVSRGGGSRRREFADAPALMPTASRHDPEDNPDAPLEPESVLNVEGAENVPSSTTAVSESPNAAIEPVSVLKVEGAESVPSSTSAVSVIAAAPIAPLCPPRRSSTPVVVPEVATTARVLPSVSHVTVSSHSAPPSAAEAVGASPQFAAAFDDTSSELKACQLQAMPSEVSEPAAAVVPSEVSESAVAVLPSEVSELAAAISTLQVHSCTIPMAVPACPARESALQHLVIDLGSLDKLVTRLEESAAFFGAPPLSTSMIDVQARERCSVFDYAIDLSALEDLVQRLERSAESLVADHKGS